MLNRDKDFCSGEDEVCEIRRMEKKKIKKKKEVWLHPRMHPTLN